MFDWTGFLSQHQIDYRAEGALNVAVHCPLCGDADASKHLAISLRGRGWRCFRNANHKGRSRAKLIQLLLRCTWEQAQRYAGIEPAPSARDEDVFAALSGFLGVSAARPPKQLSFPTEFKPLARRSISGEPFRNYMIDRGMDEDEVEWIIENYDLHYAVKGRWRNRIIIPIYDRYKKLTTWTARSIRADDQLRYKTLKVHPEDEYDEGPFALAPPGSLLLGLPLLWTCPNPRVLVPCEGPFDGMRVSAAGWSRGVYGTCLFGLQLSEAQVELLQELAERFPRRRLLLDNDAKLVAFSMVQRLEGLRCKAVSLPGGVKDPGALLPNQAAALVGRLLAT